MKKAYMMLAGLGGLFLIFFVYTVFLAENAQVKRSVKTAGPNGGYTIVTARSDGSKIIETYVVGDDGSPLSHELLSVGPEPGSEPKIMKKGTFVPKFQE